MGQNGGSGMDRLLTPPHSIEAEQAVLGGLLLDTQAWDQVGDSVTAEDFYRPDHRLIFDSISELVAESKAIDVVTVSERLERLGKLADVGGLAYLSTLVRDTPTAANSRAYAQIVRERSLMRSLISAGNAIVSSVYSDEGLSARELVNQAEARVFEIAERGAGRTEGARSVRSMLPALIDQIDEWHSNPDSLRGTPSGFTDFDRMTGGLRGGDLVIVAGRPGMGKTTLAINIGENVALDQKVRGTVLIFSMEMPTEQLMTRMLSSVGCVPLHDIRSGRISDQDWARISSATSQLQEARLYIDDQPALTPTDLRARARRVKREHGLHLVIVDYLQLMQVSGTKENRATEISEISRGLKALAKELDVPVIALSQLNRSVEQREGKKPVMSDLRECVAGDTLVCLTDGRRVPIRDLVDSMPEVWAVDDKRKVVAAASDKVWCVGRKPVFRVQLASGRSIRATAEHRLLAGEGWKTVGQIATGERLAVARHVPSPQVPRRWPDHHLVLLGHLVGDGSYIKHQPLRYTTASEENSRAVREAAEAFGSKVTRHEGRGAWHQLVIAGNGNRWHPAGVGAWLKELGIFGQRSHEKHLPRDVFMLGEEQIALLLRHLWATDGSISLRKGGSGSGARVYFATCSQLLAGDVAALLLRVGIVARIRCVHASRGRPLYTVDVSGEAQRRFLDIVGGFGPRAAPAALLMSRIEAVSANPNVDTLPVAAFAQVRARMRERGVTTRAMAQLRGTAYGGSSHFSFAPSRQTLASYARLLESTELDGWANSDLFWDRVVAVEPDGEEEVFDLTVPGSACWLADGIVTHNSGAIEQDADMILFIYREEYYDKNSPRKGEADVDLAKHRNGETGHFVLTFQGKYTRFSNHMPEAYAEGVLR
jgi:replicative DNA helicase